MAVASEAMDCSMRAWLVLPIALPSAAAAALAACRIAPACQPWTITRIIGTRTSSLPSAMPCSRALQPCGLAAAPVHRCFAEMFEHVALHVLGIHASLIK